MELGIAGTHGAAGEEMSRGFVQTALLEQELTEMMVRRRVARVREQAHAHGRPWLRPVDPDRRRILPRPFKAVARFRGELDGPAAESFRPCV